MNDDLKDELKDDLKDKPEDDLKDFILHRAGLASES